MTAEHGIVIVGAGTAGVRAAGALRAAGFDNRVILVGQEHDLPYERPALSKQFLTSDQPRESTLCRQPAWYAQQHIELHRGQPVTAVDRACRVALLADGTRLRYDRLLLATGSSARPLRVPGADLGGVYQLRTLPDAERLRGALRTLGRDNGRLLVVGAGWLGLEVAAAARGYGAEVTVAEAGTAPLHGELGEELGSFLVDLHRARGVHFECDADVTAIHGDGGMVLAAATAAGDEIPAHAVVAAVGAEPHVQLAHDAGLQLATPAEGGGVLVDQRLATTDQDIFAAGDIASVPHPPDGRRLRVDHWTAARGDGPAAARAMLGHDVDRRRVPHVHSVQYGLRMDYTGHAPPGSYDQVVVRGDLAKAHFLAFCLSGARVVAALRCTPEQQHGPAGTRPAPDSPVRQLILRGTTVDPEQLAAPDILLEKVAGCTPE